MTLTPRQTEVATLVAKGMTATRIAERLHVSTETVKAHVRDAAARMPGETPARHKLMLWFFSTKAP